MGPTALLNRCPGVDAGYMTQERLGNETGKRPHPRGQQVVANVRGMTRVLIVERLPSATCSKGMRKPVAGLRILVMDSHGEGGARDAGEALGQAGHETLACYGSRPPSFPCNALRSVGCPVDHNDVDVAVVVREHPFPKPTRLEAGVICALRQGIPLVVVGRTALSPYDRWASRTVDGYDDLVSACEEVAATRSGD